MLARLVCLPISARMCAAQLLSAALFVLTLGSAEAQQRYTATDLKTNYVSKMAPDGTEVVLENPGTPTARRMLRRTDGTLQLLTGVPADAIVSAISKAGVVGSVPDKSDCVRMPDGYDNCAQHAFIWARDRARDLGTLGGRHAALLAMNNHGDAVGWSEIRQNPPRCYPDGYRLANALLYRAGNLQDLGAFGGVCAMLTNINDSGEILGVATDAEGKTTPFLMRSGSVTRIGSLGGPSTSAWALNARGDVVGGSDVSQDVRHAFLYRDGRMLDLGTLRGARSEARGVNDAGIIVGDSQIEDRKTIHAFVYREGTMSDLNNLVDWTPGQMIGGKAPTLAVATTVAAHGEILAYVLGTDRTVGNHYVLTPQKGIGASTARAGMVFTYRLGGGTATANGVGSEKAVGVENDLTYRIVQITPSGIKWEFAMTGPAPIKGTQTVSVVDIREARRIHSKLMGGDNSAAGMLALPRISDAVYRDLKAGRPASLAFDGNSDPKVLTPDGSEEISISIDDRQTRVDALRGRGANGCHVWIAGEPGFPLLLKHDCGASIVLTSVYDPAAVGQSIADALDNASAATTGTILFAFNSADIAPESKPVLDALAVYLKGNPGLRVTIEGHTDNIGDASANLRLSSARAEAVRAYLVSQSGAAGNRIAAKGMGFTQPVASNSTTEGRSRNRRVVFKPAA